jgi:hypothetical protein
VKQRTGKGHFKFDLIPDVLPSQRFCKGISESEENSDDEKDDNQPEGFEKIAYGYQKNCYAG